MSFIEDLPTVRKHIFRAVFTGYTVFVGVVIGPIVLVAILMGAASDNPVQQALLPALAFPLIILGQGVIFGCFAKIGLAIYVHLTGANEKARDNGNDA